MSCRQIFDWHTESWFGDLNVLVLTLWKGAPPLRRDTVELHGSGKVESEAHSTKYATTAFARANAQSVRPTTHHQTNNVF